MSTRTPNQELALAWYCTEKRLNPQLSAHPVYYFTKKSNGKEIQVSLTTIMGAWNRMRKAQEAKNAKAI